VIWPPSLVPEGLDDSGAPSPELRSRPLGARIAKGTSSKTHYTCSGRGRSGRAEKGSRGRPHREKSPRSNRAYLDSSRKWQGRGFGLLETWAGEGAGWRSMAGRDCDRIYGLFLERCSGP
jgi:hypothetical protein